MRQGTSGRNLVQGVGNQQRNRGRSDRLSLVRSIEENRSSLALLKDLAGVWWSAALCDPTTLLTPGFRLHQVLSAQSSGAVRA